MLIEENIYIYIFVVIVLIVYIKYRKTINLVFQSIWDSVDEYNASYTEFSDHED